MTYHHTYMEGSCQDYNITESGCVHIPTSYFYSMYRPNMHHYWSPLPCSSHPLLFVLYCSLQLKSGLDDFKSSSFFYPFKTLMLYSLFPWLPAVLSFRLQERFWFPTLCHSSINFIFCFSFSWCFPGTCSWFHKLRWQFAQTTGVKFARVITLIVRAII